MDTEDLRSILDLDFELKASGFKSSEGDGRTAEDIEAEMEARDGTK